MRRTAVPEYLQHGQMLKQLRAHDEAHWFEFVWAEEYIRLHERYHHVQQSHDANQLCLFLGQFPYHVEGLLHLAIIFARTGALLSVLAALVKRYTQGKWTTHTTTCACVPMCTSALT
jgi:hypothetical protein